MAVVTSLNGRDFVSPEAVQAFETVADMQACTWLTAGMTCHTNGNATIGDGGAAYYKVAASGDIALQGGLYATAVQGTQTQRVSILSPALKGSAVLISNGANNVLFDCGAADDTSRLESFFAEHNVTIDCLVISHLHSDHFGGFSTVAKYLNADTDIYVQMAPTSANGDYATYTSSLTTLASVVAQYGLKEPIVPAEGLTKTYGNVTLELHNTTTANAATYDATYGDSSDLSNPASTLNNYSLISIVTIDNMVVTYSGDIEAVAERLNADYMPKADIAFLPHHLSNRWGYLKWHTNQDPQIWAATTAASTWGTNINYLWRYFNTLYVNDFIDNVYYSHDKDLVIELIDGCISRLDGNTFKDALAQNPPSHALSIYNILSPYYVNDNPLILNQISLADLMDAIENTKTGSYHKGSASTTQNGFAFFQELMSIFGTQANKYENLNAEFNVDSGVLTVRFNSDGLYYDTVIIYNDVSIANKTGYRLCASHGAAKHVYETPITANAYDLSADFDIVAWLKTARAITVRITDGTMITLNRYTSASDYFNVVAVSYVGYALNSAMNTLYRATINSSGVITVTKRTIDDATVTNAEINVLQAM